MKKYVKPDLYFDNFELSVGVAACGIQLTPGGAYKENDTGEKKYSTLAKWGVFGSGCNIDYSDSKKMEKYGYYGGLVDAPVIHS